MYRLVLFPGILFLLMILSLRADVKLSALFSNGAVLQRSATVPVFGTAEPGENVAVHIGGVSGRTVTGANGKWLVRLDLSNAGTGPFRMMVEGKNKFALNDILIGEVWLCGGQSNMEWPVRNVRDAGKEIALSGNSMIRCFTVKNMTSDVPLDHCEGVWRAASPKTTGNFTAVGYFFARELQKGLGVPVGIIDCSWGGTSIERWISREGIRLSPAMKEHVGTIIRLNNTYEDRLEKFVAAYAAWQEKFKRRRHDLQLQTANEWKNVWPGPVPGNGGILLLRKKIRLDGRKTSVNIGGINAAYEVFLNGRKVAAVSFRRAIAYPWGLNFTVGEKDVKDGDNELVIRIFSSEPVTRIHGDGRLGGEWEYQYLAEFPALSPEAEKELPHFVQGTRTPRLPCSLFNGMVNPLIPYDFAGVIWYQGESNACQPQIYTEATRALVADWRRQFGRDFSFYWCQLANYQAKSVDPAHLIPVPQTSIEYFSATPYNSDWALFREAQAKALGIPGTGQAVLIDAGEADNVHPRNKQVVGWRLAALALAKDYGKKNAFSGPVYRELKVENGKIRLFFDFAESGLTARKIPEYYIVNSGRNQFLTLRRNSPGSELEGFAVAGKDGKWFWADAEIDGDTVLVWSDKVPKPTQVRYAWSNNPTCNLYNKAGFPAAPFRSNQ